MKPSIDEDREDLLPRLAADRRELDRAVKDVRTAGAEAARQGALVVLVALGILFAVRYMFRSGRS